ncbi:hypothetical protein [Streptomyces ureilyticus]|uniref:DUF5709 domain-containing protein n=1 Tax=Streptomyces ureilyticus TaxID=1775131 RepID=A0ABX0E1I4_9ACTN|nr:hypothetical protein [Streptomyces ureilyticus]NGO45047.1 hypothetical protein [Streptomyces ureilyticus]
MTVDPTDPETLAEADSTSADSTEFDVEAPEADAAEQHAELAPHRDEPLTGSNAANLADANEADRAEQARVVELDEDDYR